ncbi:MAG: lytic transglycosylase domain-containing protein [Acidobacteriota bacterium]|jgi:soluble lytic murein transglycosylase-like protein|nr:lytic transglycosylase domain-containing protein [Bryobacteraceae bacterium CoA2 C42]MCA2963214.1 lytic transglycosylase domain-containing protein [Acidobacteriaceae bacterium]
MGFCFLSFSLLLTGAGLLCAAEAGGVRFEVKADRRTGQLIRRAVPVTGRLIAPALVSPEARAAAAPQAKPAESRIHQLVENAANHYNVDPLLVHAVIAVESNYNPYAVSPVGAQGLMQLMPGTARQLGVRNAFDAEENIRAGVRHLRDLQDQYKDDRLALAAYNAGAGAVNRYGWIPPYRETQDYVYKVGKKYGDARRAQAANPVQAAAGSSPPEVAPPPAHRPVEVFTDSEGRVHMRTK